jgi:hypothetical protein
MVRVDPAMHANAALAAELSGKSLNRWTEEKRREAADADLRAWVMGGIERSRPAVGRGY